MNITLNGTHGTTCYHADNILENGFVVSKSGEGKAGFGIYFWFYVNQNNHAIKLSRHWWSFAKSKGLYESNLDCNLKVFDVEIDIPSNNILDFVTNFDLYEKFLNLYPDGEPEKAYGAKLDLFINVLEKNMGRSFELVKVNLSVPNLRNIAFANSYPALILKAQKQVRIKKVMTEKDLEIT